MSIKNTKFFKIFDLKPKVSRFLTLWVLHCGFIVAMISLKFIWWWLNGKK